MKIIRDGKEYKLTLEEMVACFEEMQLASDIEDVRCILRKKNKWPELYRKMSVQAERDFAKKFAKHYREYLDIYSDDKEWSCLMSVYDYHIGKLDLFSNGNN